MKIFFVHLIPAIDNPRNANQSYLNVLKDEMITNLLTISGSDYQLVSNAGTPATADVTTPPPTLPPYEDSLPRNNVNNVITRNDDLYDNYKNNYLSHRVNHFFTLSHQSLRMNFRRGVGHVKPFFAGYVHLYKYYSRILAALYAAVFCSHF